MKLALVNLDMKSGDPPLGLAYIASYARKYGGFKDIIIVDKEEHLKRLEREKPDIVGISAMTHEFTHANALAKQVREKLGAPVMVGGPHISSIPAHLAPSNFDLGVIGEGEQTILELLQLFEKKGSFEPEDLKKIKGIVFRNVSGGSEQTERRPLIKNLDEIPFPARDLLKKDWYLMPRRAVLGDVMAIYTQMMTSRGCPYRCRYCQSTRSWQTFRMHSAKYVVSEMEEVINKYKVEGIVMWDDLFTANKERLAKIVGMIKEKGINERVHFSVTCRANLMNDDVCKLLKEMNVVLVGFGLESGSEKILNYLKTGNVTVADNRSAIGVTRKYGIKNCGYFIIGTPGETEDDLKQTLDLIRDPNMDTAKVFQLTPLPGTEIWEYAKKEGIVSEDFNFNLDQLSFGYKPDMILTKEMTKEKFTEWFNLFQEELKKKHHEKMLKFKPRYLKYLLSPSFVKKALWRSREIFDYMKFGK
ncbi:MAG: radical SAM protein [Candidatus Aenigmatarchaeota archaeon]